VTKGQFFELHGETEIFESNKFFVGYGETRRLFPSNKSLFDAKKLHLIQQIICLSKTILLFKAKKMNLFPRSA